MMQRINLLLLATILVLASCSNAVTDIRETANLKDSKLQAAKDFVSKVQFKVSVSPINGRPLRNAFKVTQSDLLSLVEGNQMARNVSSMVRSIEPVVYNNDTIMYLVNGQRGWKLYSVDKRLPVVLAENYEESEKKASDILNNKNIKDWILDIAGKTAYLAQTDEYDEYSNNLAVWSTQGRGIKRMPIQPVPGEYIYVGREEVFRESKFFPHVTKTLWHQQYPFSQYCPAVSAESNNRCVAGCVAVAIAQYMYFLQDNKGYTFQMPTLGTCVGAYNENYIQEFTRMSTWNISDLPLTDNRYQYSSEQFDKVALALGYVGKGVNMRYTPTASGALVVNAQNFLNANGIKGKFVSESDIVPSQIIGGRREPMVIVGSADEAGKDRYHMFLIDGCKYDSVVYEDVWRFLEDTTFYDPDRYGVILREQIIWSPRDYMYQANMGWNSNPLPGGSDADDTYYAFPEVAGYKYSRTYFRREY